MQQEEIPAYLCRRIHAYVHGEKMEDIAGRIVVHCKFYADYVNANKNNTCLLDERNKRKCLVKLTIQKETKIKLQILKD